MWWFFSYYEIVLPLEIIKHLLGIAHVDIIGTQFVMLGLIPGTNFQITFTDMLFGLWACLFIWLVIKLNKRNHFFGSNSFGTLAPTFTSLLFHQANLSKAPRSHRKA
jgi:hypothetical protein